MRLAAIAAGLFALLAVARLEAQSSRSLTDSESGILLAQGAAITVPSTADDNSDDANALREKIILLRSTINSLTDSLALSNSEAETFKRQCADLSLKLDALGIPGMEKDQTKIEQRLLSAVRDLRLLKQQNEDAVNQLVRLTEAIQVLMKSSEQIAPQVRMSVEAELRKTNDILSHPAGEAPDPGNTSLDNVSVADVKEDLSLVILNAGNQQGVRIGMPFHVLRGDKLIGEVRVIDVRERISGAIIQNLESEKEPIKAGDTLKVDAKP